MKPVAPISEGYNASGPPRRRRTVLLDARAEHIETLGILLRHALCPSVDDVEPTARSIVTAEARQVLDRMATEGLAPTAAEMEALWGNPVSGAPVAQRQSTFVDVLMTNCSPAELCVILATLRQLMDAPTILPIQAPNEPVDSVAVQNLDQAIAATMDASPVSNGQPPASFGALYEDLHEAIHLALPMRNELALALHGNAEALKAEVVAKIEVNRHTRRVARHLLKAFHTSQTLSLLSIASTEAFHAMLIDGRCPPLAVVEELEARSQDLAQAFGLMSSSETRELLTELAMAGSKSLSTDILALWAVLHKCSEQGGKSQVGVAGEDAQTVAAETSEPIEVKEVDLDVEGAMPSPGGGVGGGSGASGGAGDLTVPSGRDTGALSSDEARAVGQAIHRAINASTVACIAFSSQLRNDIQHMAEHGTRLAGETVRELHAHWGHVLRALPREELLAVTERMQRLVTDHVDLQPLAVAAQSTATRLRETELRLESNVRDHLQAAEGAYRSQVARLIHERQLAAAKVSKWFDKSRHAVESGYTAIAAGLSPHCCVSLSGLLAFFPPLLRLEIVRDFIQTISMFFNNLYTVVLQQAQAVDALHRAMNTVQVFYRGLYNLVAADFTAMYLRLDRNRLIDAGFGALLLMILLAYMAYVSFWFLAFRFKRVLKSDMTVGIESLEAGKRRVRRRQRLIQYVTYVLTLCLSLYLPITRLALEILAGSPSLDVVRLRYSSRPYWPALRIGAWVLLGTFTAPLPLLLAILVRRYKPQTIPGDPAATYNLDGERVPMDERIYAQKLAQDPAQLQCPYRSLYAGLEMRWCYYKVFQLVFKVALIVPLILIQDAAARALATLGVYTVIVIVTSATAPFSDPLNDVMEISGKLTALVTCLGGVLLAYYATSGLTMTAVGVIVNVFNVVNTVLMVTICLFGMPQTRSWIKNALGTLTFSDTVRYLQEMPSAEILPHWDIDREIKHRVWQSFWKSLLLALGDEAAIQRLAYSESEFLEEHGETTARAKASTRVGVATQRQHWAGQADECVAAMRAITRGALEGVDVYYEHDDPHARATISAFGRLRVVPYPFHCVFRYDDPRASPRERTIIEGEDFARLFFANFSPAVLRRRLVRQKLRALSAWGGTIELPMSRDEEYQMDSEAAVEAGSSRVVPFVCLYTRCTIDVRDAHDSEKREQAVTLSEDSNGGYSGGFAVRVIYSDGSGEISDPATGSILTHVHGRRLELGPEHLGLGPEMDESPCLTRLFQEHEEVLARHLPRLQERQRIHRGQHVDKQRALDRVLGPGFRHVVYNNPHLSRAALEQYLAEEETNPRLQRAPITHRPALDLLYTRMAYLATDPGVRVWYVFWDDVFAQNGDMTALAPYKAALDPQSPTALCYELMDREALKRWLQKRGLYGKKLSPWTLVHWRKSLFHRQLLDLLYAQMDRHRSGDGSSK